MPADEAKHAVMFCPAEKLHRVERMYDDCRLWRLRVRARQQTRF